MQSNLRMQRYLPRPGATYLAWVHRYVRPHGLRRPVEWDPKTPRIPQYSRSKLANLLFTYGLARRLAGSGVTANAVDPRFVSTRFATGHGPYRWCMAWWSRLFGIDSKRGAETPVYLAISAEVENTTGGYFVKSKLTPSSPASRDEAAARRLWHLSEEWAGLSEAELAAAPARGRLED
jgi:NAD(P)-dependent dehydrogenase (short-subunit alcohol dehydrogenase family)